MHLSVTAIILAAGRGTRMRSQRTKVLLPAAGRPLLEYPLLAAKRAGVGRAVVVTSPDNRDEIAGVLEGGGWFGDPEFSVSVAVQQIPRGTGDAAAAALEQVKTSECLILCGDSPLVTETELNALGSRYKREGVPLALLSCELSKPQGYGRLVRDAAGRLQAIVEEKDLAEAERGITEVNAGIYWTSTESLRTILPSLEPNNAQAELYLTDIVRRLAASGAALATCSASSEVLLGVNDRHQLFLAEELIFERTARRHREAGVSVRAGARIEDCVELEVDCEVGAQVSLSGQTSVSAGAVIEQGCVVVDSQIGARARLKPYSVVTQSVVGEQAQVGPFAHLRPGSKLGADARVGNFVETKNTVLHAGAKANHLSYLGDGDVGERANIGAGTIFCNYNGYSKARTTIGPDAFIGSDSQLVAPVRVGQGALVASGSTVTQDVPDNALAICRVPQSNKEGLAIVLRERFKAEASRNK